MRSLFFVLSVLVAQNTLAQDFIRLLNGSVAYCESRADVFKTRLHPAYRPIELERKNASATIKLEFVRCLEKADGSFAFVRELSFEKSEVSNYDHPEQKYLIERSHINMLVTNEFVELSDKKELSKNADGTYSVTVSTMADRYDNAPQGKKSLIIFVQSHMKLTDLSTGLLVDQGLDSFGAYRLIVKTEK